MANWTDGPEYAPAERPSAFATPTAEPLETPPPVPNPAAGAPVEQPGWQPPEAAVIPLQELVPASGPAPRNPQEAFAVVTAAMTGPSAWGAAHSAGGNVGRPAWTPDQPLGANLPVLAPAPSVMPAAAPDRPIGHPGQHPALGFPPPQQSSPFPQPGTPDWFAPPPEARWAPPPAQTVSIGQMWQATTTGVLVPLLIGAILTPLSLVMLGVSTALSGRVRYRRPQVRRVYVVAGSLLGVIAALTLLNDDADLETLWAVLSGWAQVTCWVLPVVLLLVVGAGIRAHEPPERN